MYQITIGTEKGFENWISLLDSKIRPIIRNDGVVICEEDNGRVFLGIGIVQEKDLDEAVYRVLFNFFLKDLKEEYLYSNIKRYATNEYLVRVYIKVLNLFNIEEERRILSERFCLYPNFSLDGFYRFRLRALREKWDDLVLLSVNNIDLIRDDYSLLMLIKHLISCLPTDNESVFVDYFEGEYRITLSTGEILFAKDSESVIFILLDHLPERIHLSKESVKSGLSDSITSVFDVKYVQII